MIIENNHLSDSEINFLIEESIKDIHNKKYGTEVDLELEKNRPFPNKYYIDFLSNQILDCSLQISALNKKTTEISIQYGTINS